MSDGLVHVGNGRVVEFKEEALPVEVPRLHEVDGSFVTSELAIRRRTVIGLKRILEIRAREEAAEISVPFYKPGKPKRYGPVKLMKARDGQCRFIAGDDDICCGHKAEIGTSWCGKHAAVVWGRSI